MGFLTRWTPQIQALLRIVTGLCFLEHGTTKFFHFPSSMGPGPLPPLMMAAGVLELVGGALVTLGLLTRPVAFILSGEMAVAYFMAHFPASPYPIVNMGEAAVLYCFIFLFLAAGGPGAWALDNALNRKRGLDPA